MLVGCLLSSFVSFLHDRKWDNCQRRFFAYLPVLSFLLATYAYPLHFSLRPYSGTDNTTSLLKIITSSDNQHYSWNDSNDPQARALQEKAERQYTILLFPMVNSNKRSESSNMFRMVYRSILMTQRSHCDKVGFHYWCRVDLLRSSWSTGRFQDRQQWRTMTTVSMPVVLAEQTPYNHYQKTWIKDYLLVFRLQYHLKMN